MVTPLTITSRIFVAGHKGMVGAAVVRHLKHLGYKHLITKSHDELELLDQDAVRCFFEEQQVDCVIVAAACVGGILANLTYPADFIYQNLAIQNNVIHEAWRAGVQHLLFLGSSCIYPKFAPQPMKEEYLLTGLLETTNEPYAVAKIAGITMCKAYNRQHGTRYFAVMPTNLYGPGDSYSLENSHVLPALIRKMHEAKKQQKKNVVLWGTGTARREFLHSDDLAEAICFLLALDSDQLFASFGKEGFPLVNIGYGKDMTIRELAEIVRKVVGYRGEISWDTSKPDGTPQKLLDIDRMTTLGWSARIPLNQGIYRVYEDFKKTWSSQK